jgi:arylformamidase
MLYDISRPIHSGMAIYPNNPEVSIRRIQKVSPSASALSEIIMGSHTGTHIDALSHIQPNASGIEAYTLDQLVGMAQVIELTPEDRVIRARHLPTISEKRVLFKTQNSSTPPDVFDPNFTALAEDTAQLLADQGVLLVGIDALSIKKKGVKDRVHEIFLSNGIVVLEGVWFADVKPGTYELICLPMPISGIDGVPARAILRI